jgi:hypothetical protein
MVTVWFGNVKLFKKVEFPTGLIPVCVISEKIWWQRHLTKLSMAWTSAVFISSLDSTGSNLYGAKIGGGLQAPLPPDHLRH